MATDYSLLRLFTGDPMPKAVPIGAGPQINYSSLLGQGGGGGIRMSTGGGSSSAEAQARLYGTPLADMKLRKEGLQAQVDLLRAQEREVDAATRLKKAALEGSYADYEKTVRQINPQQGEALSKMNQMLARAFMSNPGVQQFVAKAQAKPEGGK